MARYKNKRTGTILSTDSEMPASEWEVLDGDSITSGRGNVNDEGAKRSRSGVRRKTAPKGGKPAVSKDAASS